MNELSGKLSAIQVKQAKSKPLPYKLTDGKGLNLEVRPNGSKYWRLSYRYQQKQKKLALGVYPFITLAQVRSKSLDAKRMIQDGNDPAIIKKQKKALKVKSSFQPIAEEWQLKESGRWSKDHADRVWQSIKADALPYLGDMPINDIKTRDVLHVVKLIEDRGALDVASRVKQRISSVFRYAIQTKVIQNITP